MVTKTIISVDNPETSLTKQVSVSFFQCVEPIIFAVLNVQLINMTQASELDELEAAYETQNRLADKLHERLHELHEKYEALLREHHAESQVYFSELTQVKISEGTLAARVDFLQQAADQNIAAQERIEARFEGEELQFQLKMGALQQQLEEAKSLTITSQQDRAKIMHDMEATHEAHERTQQALQGQIDFYENQWADLRTLREEIETERAEMEAERAQDKLDIIRLNGEKAQAKQELTSAAEAIKREKDRVEWMGAFCVFTLMMAVVLNLG